VDKVAGFSGVERTDDTREIAISNTALKADSNGLGRIVLSPRYARHLANLLIEHASYAQAEAIGTYT
jgi:hypothetical protein